MKPQYIDALGVKVKVKEEEVDVPEFNKKEKTLKIKCKCGKELVTTTPVLHSQGRICETCKRHYIGEIPR